MGARTAEFSLIKMLIGRMFEEIYTATFQDTRKTQWIDSQFDGWSLMGTEAAYIGDAVIDMALSAEQELGRPALHGAGLPLHASRV